MLKRILISLSLFSPVAGYSETPIIFTSPEQKTTLVELYTSEGCSSCPPADRWLSTLKNDPRLWKEIIPVAFHVDYWNYLGWEDPFSKAEYSQRQRSYARFKNLRTVYTPGFLQNGKEWRGWFRSRGLNTTLGENVGRLIVAINENVVTAKFRPVKEIREPIILNVALLGFDQEIEIRAGENEGKTLTHDFVSYNTQAIKSVMNDGLYRWQFNIDVSDLPENKGAAFWITTENNPTPIQATGGWL